MCGIIGVIRKSKKSKPARVLVKEQFLAQKSRGTEGFGIIEIMPSGSVRVLRTTDLMDFMMTLRFDVNKDAKVVIAHHRIPTSSPNLLGQTHPILTENVQFEKSWLTVHNGIIGNDDELRELHMKEGFKYTTDMFGKPYAGANYSTSKFNDSEALAIELALYYEGKQNKLRTEGSAAFFSVGFDPKKKTADRVFFGRNTNPLAFVENKDYIIIASEAAGDLIKANTLCSIDLTDMTLVTKPLNIPERAWGNSRLSTEKSSVPAYTGKQAAGGQGKLIDTEKTVMGFDTTPAKTPVETVVKALPPGSAPVPAPIMATDDDDAIEYEGYVNDELNDAYELATNEIHALLCKIDDDDELTGMDFGADQERMVEAVTDIIADVYKSRKRELLTDVFYNKNKDDKEMKTPVDKMLENMDKELDGVEEKVFDKEFQTAFPDSERLHQKGDGKPDITDTDDDEIPYVGGGHHRHN